MAAIDFPNSPTLNQVFTAGDRSWKWNGTVWTSNNVTVSATSPITYSSGNIAFSGITLDNLTDVTAPSPSSGQIVKWNGTAWVNSGYGLDDLTDATISAPVTGQVLIYNGSGWVNTSTPTLAGKLTLSASGIEFTDGTQTKAGVPSVVTISQKNSSYSLSAVSEKDTVIEINNSSPTTLTIPTEATVDYPVGSTLDILQTGSGQVTIAGAVGVTVNATPGLKLRAQWSSATLMKRGSNSWVVFGDLTA